MFELSNDHRKCCVIFSISRECGLCGLYENQNVMQLPCNWHTRLCRPIFLLEDKIDDLQLTAVW